ncbi:hypothetical protein FB45DRAFT_869189 [Roridomyces roridus]|uniref:Uncharacterized protein n=1 Tax=Roridomyces roridus TaxID=1738132 RepID=A0AAD7FIQ7_9AGAR|nr:hypothetical protein FB45DRAFT_869189 [Roridomyces roridus]
MPLLDLQADRSEYAEARQMFLQVAVEVDFEPYTQGLGLLNLARVDIILGQGAEVVQQTMQKARQIFRTLEHPTALTMCDIVLADLDVREGNAHEAYIEYQRCMESALGNSIQTSGHCLEKLANPSNWTQLGSVWNSSWAIVFLGHAVKSGHKLQIFKSLSSLGGVFISVGDDSSAESLFTVAMDGFTAMDVHSGRGTCMEGLGDIAQKRGDYDAAMRLYEDAKLLFLRSCDKVNIDGVQKRLVELGSVIRQVKRLELAEHDQGLVEETTANQRRAVQTTPLHG